MNDNRRPPSGRTRTDARGAAGAPPPRPPVRPGSAPQQRPHPRPNASQDSVRRIPPSPHRNPARPSPQQAAALRERQRRREAARRARNRRILLCALTAALLVLAVVLLCTRLARRAAEPGDSSSAPGVISTTAPDAVTSAAPAVLVTEAPPLPEDTTTPDTGVTESAAPVAIRPVAAQEMLDLTDMIDSTSAALLSLSSGEILAGENAFARINPASMTKIMTVLVAYEHAASLDDTFTVTNTIIDPVYRAGASLAGFAAGETVTVRDLLYGTALPSGAEAAVSLAVYTAGSEEDFAALMNEKAAELGMAGSHFTNCTGLHGDDHYSTCADIAVLLAYALEYPECREILSSYEYTTSPTAQHPDGVKLTSTVFSRMYGTEAAGMTILAGKTGYTPEAGQCLASYAERIRDGAGFVFVTGGAEGKFEPVFDAIRVYGEIAAIN